MGSRCTEATTTPTEAPIVAPAKTSVGKCCPARTRAVAMDDAVPRPTPSTSQGSAEWGCKRFVAMNMEVATANEIDVWLLMNDNAASPLVRSASGALLPYVYGRGRDVASVVIEGSAVATKPASATTTMSFNAGIAPSSTRSTVAAPAVSDMSPTSEYVLHPGSHVPAKCRSKAFNSAGSQWPSTMAQEG